MHEVDINTQFCAVQKIEKKKIRKKKKINDYCTIDVWLNCITVFGCSSGAFKKSPTSSHCALFFSLRHFFFRCFSFEFTKLNWKTMLWNYVFIRFPHCSMVLNYKIVVETMKRRQNLSNVQSENSSLISWFWQLILQCRRRQVVNFKCAEWE